MAHLTTKHLSNIPLELASLAFLLSFPWKNLFKPCIACCQFVPFVPLWLSTCPLEKPLQTLDCLFVPFVPHGCLFVPFIPHGCLFVPYVPYGCLFVPYVCLSHSCLFVPLSPLWLSICPLFPPMVVYLSPLSVTLMSICPLFTPMLVYLSPLSVCHTHVYLSPLAPYGCLFVPWKNCYKPWTHTVWHTEKMLQTPHFGLEVGRFLRIRNHELGLILD